MQHAVYVFHRCSKSTLSHTLFRGSTLGQQLLLRWAQDQIEGARQAMHATATLLRKLKKDAEKIKQVHYPPPPCFPSLCPPPLLPPPYAIQLLMGVSLEVSLLLIQ